MQCPSPPLTPIWITDSEDETVSISDMSEDREFIGSQQSQDLTMNGPTLHRRESFGNLDNLNEGNTLDTNTGSSFSPLPRNLAYEESPPSILLPDTMNYQDLPPLMPTSASLTQELMDRLNAESGPSNVTQPPTGNESGNLQEQETTAR